MTLGSGGRGITPIDESWLRIAPWIPAALTASPFPEASRSTSRCTDGVLLIPVRPRVNGGYPPVFTVIVSTQFPWCAPSPLLTTGCPRLPALHRNASLGPRPSRFDNQELRLLTPLGRARYGDLEDVAAGPRIDLVETDGGLWFAGIPKPGDLDRLDAILSAPRDLVDDVGWPARRR